VEGEVHVEASEGVVVGVVTEGVSEEGEEEVIVEAAGGAEEVIVEDSGGEEEVVEGVSLMS